MHGQATRSEAGDPGPIARPAPFAARITVQLGAVTNLSPRRLAVDRARKVNTSKIRRAIIANGANLSGGNVHGADASGVSG